MPSLFKWLAKNTCIRADMKFKGGSLRLTEPEIQDAPLIFMTGHDKDITVGRGLAKDGPLLDGFSTEERAALRRNIVERGGMLFFDDCGFNGLFAQQVALELGKGKLHNADPKTEKSVNAKPLSRYLTEHQHPKPDQDS